MLVDQPAMPIRVAMWHLPIPREVMFMPMMFVVRVAVRVLKLDVRVLMFVALSDVQPDPQRHQPGCSRERSRRRLGPEHERDHDAEERSHR
jgi:hypothetical protein